MLISRNRLIPEADPRRYLPFFEGEGDAGGGGATGDGAGEGAPASTATPPADRTFSQQEVTALATREKNEGKAAALKDAAKLLGVESLDEAKTILEAARAAQDKEKTEAQRAKEAADAAKLESDREAGESKLEKHNAAVERQLIRQLPGDLDDDALDKRVRRIAKLVEVEVGADAEAIKAAVGALKKDMPELFGAAAGKGGGTPNGDPKGGPPKPTQDSDSFKRGADRAKVGAGSTEDRYSKLLGNPAT